MVVPMFIRLSSSNVLEQGAARGFGQLSTLLLALGYDAGWVKETYGPSLMDSPSSDRKVHDRKSYFQTSVIPYRAPAYRDPVAK
jgi:hypothetical protein